MAIIEVSDLVKEFKIAERKQGLGGAFANLFSSRHRIMKAVDGISFDIERGECIGFIGPNGAGKSTTIKILTGILYPTTGSVSVLGLVPFEQREQYVKHIGVVFGQRTQLWWDLPVRESFNLLKHIYEIPESKFKKNMSEFSRVLEIDKLLDVPVRKLSLGQRMRCDLAASLLHEPEIIFLDEPTIGLDVIAKERIREFIQKLNKKQKTTVILTTHDMNDIEQLCERTIIIDKGKIMYDGALSEIRNKFAQDKILIVDFHNSVKRIRLKGVRVAKRIENRFWLRVNKSNNVTEIVNKILSKYSVHDLTIEEPKIEEIIQKIYKKGV